MYSGSSDSTCRCDHSRYMHEHDFNGTYCDEYSCTCQRWRGQLTTLKKMSTKDFRALLVDDGKKGKCWTRVLRAFCADYVNTGKGESTGKINNYLSEAGYTVERVHLKDAMPAVTQDSSYTVAAFFGTKPEGDWLVYTPGHVFCLKDGKITDSMGEYSTVARRVEMLYRVTRADVPVRPAAETLTLAASDHMEVKEI